MDDSTTIPPRPMRPMNDLDPVRAGLFDLVEELQRLQQVDSAIPAREETFATAAHRLTALCPSRHSAWIVEQLGLIARLHGIDSVRPG